MGDTCSQHLSNLQPLGGLGDRPRGKIRFEAEFRGFGLVSTPLDSYRRVRRETGNSYLLIMAILLTPPTTASSEWASWTTTGYGLLPPGVV